MYVFSLYITDWVGIPTKFTQNSISPSVNFEPGQTRPDCLITEIPQQPINYTNTSRGVGHVVPLLRSLGSGVHFVAQQQIQKIKFWSWNCIFVAVQSQFWPADHHLFAQA